MYVISADSVLQRLAAEFGDRAPRRAAPSDRPQAAVALLLAPEPDRLLLIRRALREGDPWSGQLALPGGRHAAGDFDLLATAIREAEEETGVRLEREWCRAELDDLAPRTPTLPPIMVRPFLFLMSDAIRPGLSHEVVHAAWIPLADLLVEGVRGPRTMLVCGEPHVADGYQLPLGFLWGMTERIVTPVLAAWQTLARPRAGGDQPS